MLVQELILGAFTDVFFQRPILQLLTLSIYVLCVLFIRHLWHSTWILRSFTYLSKAFWHVFYVEHKWWWSKNWSLAHTWFNFLPLGGSKWLLFELRNEWPSYESTDIKLILQFVTSGDYICYLCSFSFAPPDQILQHSIQSHQCNQKFSIRKRKLDSCIGQFVYTSTHFLLHLNDLRQRLTSGSNPNIKERKLSFNRKCSSPLSLP